jgi:hypothetical protein
MVLSDCCRVGSWWPATRLGRAVNSMIRYQFIMEALDTMLLVRTEQEEHPTPERSAAARARGCL